MDSNLIFFCFFFFKQKTAYEMLRSLVGSEMCIRDSTCRLCGCVGIGNRFISLFSKWVVCPNAHRALTSLHSLSVGDVRTWKRNHAVDVLHSFDPWERRRSAPHIDWSLPHDDVPLLLPPPTVDPADYYDDPSPLQ
eukprot:TRINITY_DN31663_c0_g1_i1.p2 TRINITY_DN31663_c0_g1~~TRINITY_DN31663_c0_g1_i1.p2  ORF type:complete len:136 (+),score=25.92 TRINITY_DN31663_c0_g1_i1:88-495(+)